MKIKKTFIRLVYLSCFVLVFNVNSYCQINLVWDDVFNGYWDLKLESDQLGNCYLQYYIYGSVTDSMMLAKYDSTGVKLWDKAVYIDTSTTNNLSFVYFYIDDLNFPVIQFRSSDGNTDQYYLLKCDTSGNFIWKVETDLSQRCVFDNGNIYHVGRYLSEMVLYKYDSAGVLQFESSRPFTSGSYGAEPLIDAFENVYFSYKDSISKTYKVNPSGLIIDSIFFTETMYSPIIDSQNHLIYFYAIKYPPTGPTDSTKLAFRKYDSTFNLIWESDPFSFGAPSQVLVDHSDNIYIESIWQFDSGLPLELKLVKLNQNGDLQWIRNFGTIGGLTQYYDAVILINTDNNPVVVGEYYPNGHTISPSTPTETIFIAMLDSAGTLVEYEEFYGNANLNLHAFPSMNLNRIQMGLTYSSTQQTHIIDFCIGCPNTLSGYVYFDSDSSCTFDSLEIGLAHAVVEILPDSVYRLTDSNGKYHAYFHDGNYDVTGLPYLNFQTACAVNTQNITVSNGVPVQNVNFGKYLNSGINDLFINIGRGPVRPGFNSIFVLNFQNRGGSIQSGEVNFIPENFFNFIQASMPPVFPGGDTLRWSFNNLLPGESRNINIILNTPVSIFPGTPFINSVIISSPAIDVSPLNNIVHDQGIITGSFDPNNKTVIPQGIGPEGYITNNDSTLHYTVNFENYGNDTAFTVIVLDTLDQNLDVTTLTIGSVSHPFTLELLHSRILRFRFDNILLADSSNKSENYGFINYFIEQKPNLAIGTQITNGADIYFDYNLPEKTPKTLNTIFDPTGLVESTQEDFFQIFPNPVESNLHIIFLNSTYISEISLVNIRGELIYSKEVKSKGNIIVNLNTFARGVYIVKLNTDTSTSFRKIVKL